MRRACFGADVVKILVARVCSVVALVSWCGRSSWGEGKQLADMRFVRPFAPAGAFVAVLATASPGVECGAELDTFSAIACIATMRPGIALVNWCWDRGRRRLADMIVVRVLAARHTNVALLAGAGPFVPIIADF